MNGTWPLSCRDSPDKEQSEGLVFFRHAQQEQEVIYMHKCLTFTPFYFVEKLNMEILSEHVRLTFESKMRV